jgi:flagellar assembly protein FliH
MTIMSSLPEALFAPDGGFTADTRFGVFPASGNRVVPEDPAETAFSEGYAKGFEDATAKAKSQADQDAAARGKIETAFERLAEAEGLRLEERLRETVLALCEHTLAPLATDLDALTARISRALTALRRSEDERLLRLHPDDLALLANRLPAGVKVEVDPSLARGELRVETADGGLEDGPEQWRRALAEALAL